MKMYFLLPLAAVFSVLAGSILADTRVRHVLVEKDQIVTVKTSLGVATIVQVPDKPNSVVVGDMNAFKVEYLDTAITIKALTNHAKSNLYIYTDFRRFNVQLVTGAESSADYVVYLDNPKAKAKPHEDKAGDGIKWHRLSKSMSNSELSVRTTRIGIRDSDGMMFIDFVLTSSKAEAIHPEWFWLTQSGVTKPIQGLVLSSLQVTPKDQIAGMIEIMKTDLSASEPMRIELRRKKTSCLTFQGVNGWNF